MQFSPSDILKPYIKSYSVITIDKDLKDEVFYPSGFVDFVVKISNGSALTIINGRARSTPEVELLGHLTVPTRLNVTKGTSILIARMYPFASSLFFPNPISDFTNYATDLYNVFSREIYELYSGITQAATIESKIKVLDRFLFQKLRQNECRLGRVAMIAQLCRHITSLDQSFSIQRLCDGYAYSERSVEKMFLEFVGISPRSFFSVSRFNKSLDQVLASEKQLTAIAYDCGYYDQAHFIKEFKTFTGITPASARRSLLKNGEEFQQAVNIGF